MMQRWIGLVTLLALLGGVLLAQDSAEVEPWVCPPGFEGQRLSVFNWSTYIAEDTIPNFEKACGVTVDYSIYESSEAMLGKIIQGNPGYDIVVPSGNTVGRMIELGLAVPLDKSLIPNFANLSEALLDPTYDPGNVYSIPYQWGTIGVGYNREKVGFEITSWDQVWDYQGKVAWLNDPRAIMGIGLHLLGFDPNTTDADEIAQARDFLVSKGGNVVTIAGDDGQVLLERGDVDITIEYNGDIVNLGYECECDTFAYVVPDEGSVIWVDSMMIPKDAPNVALAHAFIDYILHPQVGADISNYTTYASPNQAAIDLGLIDEAFLNDSAIYPDEAKLERLFSIDHVGSAAEVIYSNAWDELLIFLGR
jgi:spermidine/putrescine transport system substrate-binding protein